VVLPGDKSRIRKGPEIFIHYPVKLICVIVNDETTWIHQ
jgi:hypothetical protein